MALVQSRTELKIVTFFEIESHVQIMTSMHNEVMQVLFILVQCAT